MPPQGILIIGATGFSGSSLLKRLAGDHPEIYLLAKNSLSQQPNYAGNIVSYSTSLDNTELLNKILPNCKTVIHLASASTPGSSLLLPSIEAEKNLLPTLRFLECLQAYKHVSLIYLSSGGAIYGDPGKTLVKEEDSLVPLSYYGAGKASIEKFILAFCQQTKNSATILRPANFYGPGQPYQKGFGIVPTIFHHALTNTPLKIWGDGETVRDYLFIDDFLDLCVELINSPLKGKNVNIYNVGSEKGTSLNELCRLAEKVTGMTISLQYEKSRGVDVKSVILDCSRVKDDYNWTSKTNLRSGLDKTWQWFRQRKT